LTDSNIGNSRDTSFEQLVLNQTCGRGVDLVLNSLAEDKLQASIRCLALGGRFLEIGKYDLSNNNPLVNLFKRIYLCILLMYVYFLGYGCVLKKYNIPRNPIGCSL